MLLVWVFSGLITYYEMTDWCALPLGSVFPLFLALLSYIVLQAVLGLHEISPIHDSGYKKKKKKQIILSIFAS